jgi:hypothetical protein
MRCKGFAVGVGLFLALSCWSGAEAFAQNGSAAFPPTREIEIGGQKVRLVKTGQAVRKKLVFSVYSVASYVQEDVTVRNAQELIDVDCPKVLHLIMLRTVSGADMADSLLSILRQNHPAPAFAGEARALADKMRSSTAQNGDHILITHIPKVGLHFKHVGGEEILIRNAAFSRAMWECYFGKHNVGEDVKRGLLSSLEK